VQVLSTALGAALPQIKSGRLRALAVTGLKRTHVAPEIPTAAESGLPGYVVDGWFAALAPARTPAAVVGRLQSDFSSVYQMPDVAERLMAAGFDAGGTTPRETTIFIAEEMAKWGKLIKAAGIKGE
jgi:tripartite-type tricarboxylate transporter receptor subunit TctC